MSSEKKRTDVKKTVEKKVDKPVRPKKEIEIINDGPIYICDACHALLKVPEECIEEEEIEEQDEEGTFIVIEQRFTCPKCNEENVFTEEVDDEEEEEEEKPAKSKPKKEKSSSKDR